MDARSLACCRILWSTVARCVCDGITVVIYGDLVSIGLCAMQPLFPTCVGVATECEVFVYDFATLLPHAQIAQRRGH